MICLTLAISTEYRRVTDGRTDRWTDRRTSCDGIASRGKKRVYKRFWLCGERVHVLTLDPLTRCQLCNRYWQSFLTAKTPVSACNVINVNSVRCGLQAPTINPWSIVGFSCTSIHHLYVVSGCFLWTPVINWLMGFSWWCYGAGRRCRGFQLHCHA